MSLSTSGSAQPPVEVRGGCGARVVRARARPGASPPQPCRILASWKRASSSAGRGSVGVVLDVRQRSSVFRRGENRAPRNRESLHRGARGGEIVAVVGASGSGKSLLADAVMGLYEPNARVTGAHLVRRSASGCEQPFSLAGSGLVAFCPKAFPADPLMKVGRQVGRLVGSRRGSPCRQGQARAKAGGGAVRAIRVGAGGRAAVSA